MAIAAPCVDRRRSCNSQQSSIICKYWLAGTCNRNPCRFAHQHHPLQRGGGRTWNLTPTPGEKIKKEEKQPHAAAADVRKHVLSPSTATESTDISAKIFQTQTDTTAVSIKKATDQKKKQKRKATNRPEAEPNPKKTKTTAKEEKWTSWSYKGQFLHSWVTGNANPVITRLAELKGHTRAVTGIAFTSVSQVLYTGSRDGTLRAWDARTGHCIDCLNLNAEVGCLISQDSWVFAGVPNAIKAFHAVVTSLSLSLDGPIGQVYAMVVCHDTLFAACEDGNILAYEPSEEEKTFKLIATLGGHSGAVLSLSTAKGLVYSGSADGSIRCWNPDTFRCSHKIEGHAGPVTSLAIRDTYIISGFSDKTVKVWARMPADIVEICTCSEDNGVITFMYDTAAEPQLFISCTTPSSREQELDLAYPGEVFVSREVSIVAESDGPLFFTGDSSGNVDVWKWLGQPSLVPETPILR
uniref:C3H1-type domain-containing protein n=1 Tax=Kalanchoe fedtschenkoi TaxID=63787 RepID=A0A7N0SW94_KALFE